MPVPTTTTIRRADAAPDATVSSALREWIRTDCPVRFAARHLALAVALLAVGTAAAVLMRLELLTPRLDLMEARTFGALLSLHGSLLFYLACLPVFPAVLGYLWLARHAGVRRLAWPRLMLPAWGLLVLGGLITIDGFLRGGTEAGWTFDAQFAGHFADVGVLSMAAGVGAAGAAVALLGANLAATLWRARAAVAAPDRPGALALLCAGGNAALAGVGIAAGAVVVMLDHRVGTKLFDPAAGGNPLLYKACSCLVLSAAQNTMLLIAFAVVLSIVAERAPAGPTARRSRALRRSIAFLALAGIGAWPATEARPLTGAISEQMAGVLYAVAAAAVAALVLRTIAMLGRRRALFDAPLLFASGFLLGMPVLIGSGAMLAAPATGHLLGSTTFATAHFHVLALTLGMAFLAGLHDAWPQLSGRRYTRSIAVVAAIVIFAGTWLTFVPMFALGLAGASFRANSYPAGFQVPEVLATAGMTVLLAGLALALANLLAGWCGGWSSR